MRSDSKISLLAFSNATCVIDLYALYVYGAIVALLSSIYFLCERNIEKRKKNIKISTLDSGPSKPQADKVTSFFSVLKDTGFLPDKFIEIF
jgi:hypothetical protein